MTLTQSLKRRVAKPVIALVVLYSIAFAFIPLNGGIFWDDWTLVGVNRQAIISDFIDYGIPQQGYFLTFFAPVSQAAVVGHVLIFLLFLGATLILYDILKTVPAISLDRWYIAALFAVWPVNFARISLATLPYAACLFLFFLAWLIIARRPGKNLWRVLALGTFFISFSLNSLLVWYAIILSYVLARDFKRLRTITATLRANIDFIILPIAYWWLQKNLFSPQGSYTGYNIITWANLVEIPKQTLMAFSTAFVEPIVRSLAHPLGITIAALILMVALYKQKKAVVVPSLSLKVLGVSIIIFTLGAFPYLAAGHAPTFFEWTSRHQLLAPLGASLLLYAIINGICVFLQWPWAQKPLLLAAIASFIVFNSSIYMSFTRDWLKQDSLIEHLRTNPAVHENRTFVIDDHTSEYDAIGRTYRFYEYNGIFRQTFHDQIRLGIPIGSSMTPADYMKYTVSDRYSMSLYRDDGRLYSMTIIRGKSPLTTANTLQLLAWRWTNRERYSSTIAEVLSLKVSKLAIDKNTRGIAP